MLRGSLGRATILNQAVGTLLIQQIVIPSFTKQPLVLLLHRSDRMRALCTLALAATLGTVSAFLPSAQVTSSLPVHRTALTGR